MKINNIIQWIIALSILFLLPLAVPIMIFFLLNPIGFWQCLVFLIVGSVLYFIALVFEWFIFYIFT